MVEKIDGECKKTKKFLDKETNEILDVELSIRDIMFFDRLDQLISAVRRGKNA